ncbi:MAG TPA: NAD(P)H-binding protein [Solirubrobacteraceae bacterium]|nr:NAD(P)H-binding protein [Solirubrobacteraceae bacterium]
MRIAVIGASGWLGGAIAREALARGHEVTAIGRDPDKLATLSDARAATVDATDAAALPGVIGGHDVVVQAVTDRSGSSRDTIPDTTAALIAAVPAAGVARLAVVGGGGSLLDTNGIRYIDRPDFPEQYRVEAQAGLRALELLRAAPAQLDWTYLSPPPHDLVPGDARGGYTTRGDDHAVTGPDGHSAITSGDLAAAMLDELESPQYVRRRFTAGYPDA